MTVGCGGGDALISSIAPLRNMQSVAGFTIALCGLLILAGF
jgi:hypothetical protein